MSKDDLMLTPHTSSSASKSHAQERRLHLRAFDYWHALQGADEKLPDFAALTPSGLSPFKSNSLLLEILGDEIAVRFCGSQMTPVFGMSVPRGTTLSGLADSDFARALEMQLRVPQSRIMAAEFDYDHEGFECRGIMLPFNAGSDVAKFIMVVVNYRLQQGEHDGDYDNAVDAETFAVLKEQADACAGEGAAVIHPDSGSRESLYSALASAYRFHLEAARDPLAYQRFLRTEGLRQQRRAPFTPALKLTFGKDYDKTRLTEYAAALSFAAQSEVGPDGLVDFLKNQPGGIKGCVQQLRDFKRGKKPTAPTMQKDALRRKQVATAPPLALEDIALTSDIDLLLARRTEGGKTEIIGALGAQGALIKQALARWSAALKEE